jgi:hypothetical protein
VCCSIKNLSILILYESWGMRIGYFSSLWLLQDKT